MTPVHSLHGGVMSIITCPQPRPGVRRAVARGFTLLELLVVMVIIGLLAGYVAPKYFSQIGKSEVKVARAQIDALEKALDQYRRTPATTTTERDWRRFCKRQRTRWDGPYLKSRSIDPWKNGTNRREHGGLTSLSAGWATRWTDEWLTSLTVITHAIEVEALRGREFISLRLETPATMVSARHGRRATPFPPVRSPGIGWQIRGRKHFPLMLFNRNCSPDRQA